MKVPEKFCARVCIYVRTKSASPVAESSTSWAPAAAEALLRAFNFRRVVTPGGRCRRHGPGEGGHGPQAPGRAPSTLSRLLHRVSRCSRRLRVCAENIDAATGQQRVLSTCSVRRLRIFLSRVCVDTFVCNLHSQECLPFPGSWLSVKT